MIKEERIRQSLHCFLITTVLYDIEKTGQKVFRSWTFHIVLLFWSILLYSGSGYMLLYSVLAHIIVLLFWSILLYSGSGLCCFILFWHTFLYFGSGPFKNILGLIHIFIIWVWFVLMYFGSGLSCCILFLHTFLYFGSGSYYCILSLVYIVVFCSGTHFGSDLHYSLIPLIVKNK